MEGNLKNSLRQRRFTYARAFGAFLLILLFQNCGKPFEVAQLAEYDSSSLSPDSMVPGDFCMIANGVGKRDTSLKCVVQSCLSLYHQENQTCVNNQKDCTIQGGLGVQTWTGTAWGVCAASACPAGQHQEAGSCVSNQRACAVSGGSGIQAWSGASWGACEVSACNAGFRLEGSSCVSASENQVCQSNGLPGTQGYVGGAWNSCRVCGDAYTSFKGACHENPAFVRKYASLLPLCWSDGIVTCAVPSFAGYIGTPSTYTVTVGQSVAFPVTFTGASSINLTASQVQLSGPGSSGCQKMISGSGSERQIILSNCSSVGTVKITIAAGSATNANGQSLESFGPSPDVAVANVSTLTVPSIQKGDINYTGAGGRLIPYEYHYPADFASRTNIPIIIWLHGGGWSGGNAADDRPWAQALADVGFLVFNLNYTLAAPGVGNYTSGPDDINSFMTYLRNNVHILNGDLSKVSIAGISAGGHLALHQATRPDNTMQFRCVINVSGPTDLIGIRGTTNYPLSNEILKSVFGQTTSIVQANSPVHNFGNFKGQKLGLFHQLQDNLVPISQALQLVATVKEVNPGLDMAIVYGDEYNPYWINPDSAQLTHVYSAAGMIYGSLKSYIHTNCR